MSIPLKNAVLTAVVVSLSLPLSMAQANQDLTLTQALQSLDSSPRLEKSKASAEEASWKSVEAFSGMLPTLTLGANRLLDKKYLITDITFNGNPASVPQILSTTNYSLGASMTLFDGFAVVDRYTGAKALSNASQKEYEWDRFQTSRQIVLLFYTALAAGTLKEVAGQNVKTLEEHMNDVQLTKRAGASTKFDVLQVDVKATEARNELLNAADNYEVSRLRLSEVLGENFANKTLVGDLPVLSSQAIAKLTNDTTERKDLVALNDRVLGLHRIERASEKYWVPKIQAVAQWQKYDNRGDAWDPDNKEFRDAYTVGLQATWTFDGIIGPTARSHQATEQRIQTEKSLEIAKLKAANDLEFWRRRFLYFCSVYKARTDDIGKSTESVRLAREGRRAGIRTNTDLLDAELELFRARAGRVTAQLGAIEALINLELATGQELYKFQ